MNVYRADSSGPRDRALQAFLQGASRVGRARARHLGRAFVLWGFSRPRRPAPSRDIRSFERKMHPPAVVVAFRSKKRVCRPQRLFLGPLGGVRGRKWASGEALRSVFEAWQENRIHLSCYALKTHAGIPDTRRSRPRVRRARILVIDTPSVVGCLRAENNHSNSAFCHAMPCHATIRLPATTIRPSATISGNSNAVQLLGLTVSDPPTQAEVQTLANKIDELISALRR